MNILLLAVLLVLCTLCQSITFSTVARVSLALLSLNNPVSGFFGMFRRRKSPPIQETMAPTEAPMRFPFSQPFFSAMNPFGGFGAGGLFFPGANNPFGMISPSNRFPPQFKPPTPMRPPQKSGMPPQGMFPPQQQAMQDFPQQHNMQQFQPQHQQGMQNFPSQHQQGMQNFPSQHQQGMQNFPPQHQGMQQFPQQQMDMDSFGDSDDEGPPGMNTEEAESFFTLLSETDESKCISRLVCEMGANPESGGEFGQTIVEIIGSLKDFPDGSKVTEYNEVLNLGVAEGMSACLSKFSVCDEESYQLVRKAQLEGENE